MMQKRIYIAGPDVFSPDWPLIAQHAQKVCSDMGFVAELPIPAQPLTGVGITSKGDAKTASAIFKSCIQSIGKSDAIVANLTPFRGVEPDSGTVVECAIACALGIPVIGYAAYKIDPNAYLCAFQNPDGSFVSQEDGYLIEQFGLPFNLMVAGVCTDFVIGNIESALHKVEAVFRNGVSNTKNPSV